MTPQTDPAPEQPEPAAQHPVDPADPAEPAEVPEVPEGTVLLVRRRRTPTLGFWVLVSMVLAALVGVGIALAVGVVHLAGLLYFAVTAAVFIGLPLAAGFSFWDALRHRRSDRRR